MTEAVPKKIKVQCRHCKKSFGGTVEKIEKTAQCPKCAAGDDWWRPIETRMIQRSRIKAQGAPMPQQYVPPPAPGGYQWVPRETAKNRELVFGLGLAGIVLSPIGLITGPIGLWKAREGLGQVKRGEVPSDSLLTGGIALCGISILVSILGAWYCYIAIEYVMSFDKIDRAETQVAAIAQAVENHGNRHYKIPRTLQEVRDEGATFADKDPWGNDFGYRVTGSGSNERAIITCFGADGKPGGELADEDIVLELEWKSPIEQMHPWMSDYMR